MTAVILVCREDGRSKLFAQKSNYGLQKILQAQTLQTVGKRGICIGVFYHSGGEAFSLIPIVVYNETVWMKT